MRRFALTIAAVCGLAVSSLPAQAGEFHLHIGRDHGHGFFGPPVHRHHWHHHHRPWRHHHHHWGHYHAPVREVHVYHHPHYAPPVVGPYHAPCY